MTEFGARFKKARESLGVSLNQIAVETRISTRFLLAIENEEFRNLPGGIFNRGFIRAYAQRVGIDADQAVADYERLVQAGGDEPSLLSADPHSQPKNPRHLYTVAIGALLLLIGIFYVVTRNANTTSVTAGRVPVETPAQPTPPPTPTPEATATENTPAIAPETKPTESAVSAPALSAPVTHGPLVLEVAVHEKAWIKVSADGSTVLNEELQPGATRTVTAQNSISIRTGNAGGLSLKLNDKAVRPLGRSGDVRDLTITTENAAQIIG
jgi:cytoskeletal protein RodZ